MLKDNHELRMKYAELLANTNNELMSTSGEPIIFFEFEGVAIHDPFTEESGRFEVDPVKYYGEAFLNSAFYNPLNKQSTFIKFNEAELVEIKFLLSMIYKNKFIDKLNNLEYYEVNETMDRLKGILDKLEDVELNDELKKYLENKQK